MPSYTRSNPTWLVKKSDLNAIGGHVLLRCELCGKVAHPHHIITRGSRGDDALIEANEIPLCFEHHREVHTIGRRSFEIKYSLDERFKAAEKAVHDKTFARLRKPVAAVKRVMSE